MSDKKEEILIRKIKRLEKSVKKLKSENRTILDAWRKTEEYLTAISEGKKLKEIFDEIDTKTELKKVNKKCPNGQCNNSNLNKRMYDEYHVLSCSKCGYRNSVNEEGPSEG